MVGKPKFATKRKIVISLACLILCLSLGGCRYGEVGREGIACDYVVKEADAFARDLGNSLDCYVNEIRDVFNDKNIANFFEPEGGAFYMLTTRECKTGHKVIYTDQRTFFSYHAKCFRYTGGAHGGTIVKDGTMDVRTGKRPTPADVIPAYGKYKKMILETR